jgi:hypothetical protein
MRLPDSLLVGHPRISAMGGLLAAFAVLGCEEPVTAVPATTPTVAFARTVDTHSRANLVWQDVIDTGSPGAPSLVTAGIRGDGKNKYGGSEAPANEYQGSVCGVRATIFDQKGENGNLNPDPDSDYNSTMDVACGGGRRSMVLNIGTEGATAGEHAPVVTGPMFLIDAIWTLGPGAVRLQPMDFGVQDGQSDCRFSFNTAYAGASSVRLTRLPDVPIGATVTARQWRLQSQGTHTAACLILQKSGKYADNGARYTLPFDVTITQAQYPFDTYPTIVP